MSRTRVNFWNEKSRFAIGLDNEADLYWCEGAGGIGRAIALQGLRFSFSFYLPILEVSTASRFFSLYPPNL